MPFIAKLVIGLIVGMIAAAARIVIEVWREDREAIARREPTHD